MEPGHPFRTDELDERRERQRRVLRLIPTPFFMENAPEEADLGYVPAREQAFLETGLRRRADVLLLEHAELLEAVGKFTEASRVATFMGSETGDFGRQNDMGLTWLVSETGDAEGRARYGQLVGEELEALRRTLTILVLADKVAEDGYRDPRLPDTAEASAS